MQKKIIPPPETPPNAAEIRELETSTSCKNFPIPHYGDFSLNKSISKSEEPPVINNSGNYF